MVGGGVRRASRFSIAEDLYDGDGVFRGLLKLRLNASAALRALSLTVVSSCDSSETEKDMGVTKRVP